MILQQRPYKTVLSPLFHLLSNSDLRYTQKIEYIEIMTPSLVSKKTMDLARALDQENRKIPGHVLAYNS